MLLQKRHEGVHVADLVDMVVVERHLGHDLVTFAERLQEGLRVADAREGDHQPPLRQRLAGRLLGVERLGHETLETREIDPLVGHLDQHLAQDAAVDRGHPLGAFRDHEIVGAVQLLRKVAQRSHGQHPVVLDGPRGVDHHDIDFRFHVAVLETVVHNDQVDLGMLGADAADAFGTLLADGDHRIGKLELDLQRLVAHVAVVRVGTHLQIPFRTASVTAREQRHVVHLGHVGNYHFGHRGLARAADGDVADADDRNVELLALEDAPVEEAVTERHPRFIEEGRRCEQAFEHLSIGLNR